MVKVSGSLGHGQDLRVSCLGQNLKGFSLGLDVMWCCLGPSCNYMYMYERWLPFLSLNRLISQMWTTQNAVPRGHTNFQVWPHKPRGHTWKAQFLCQSLKNLSMLQLIGLMVWCIIYTFTVFVIYLSYIVIALATPATSTVEINLAKLHKVHFSSDVHLVVQNVVNMWTNVTGIVSEVYGPGFQGA